MNLRDHGRECEHGAMGPHTIQGCGSTIPPLFASVGICPGGREVVIDYEAGGRALFDELRRRADILAAIPFPPESTRAFWNLTEIEAATIAIGAALGIQP